MKAESAVRAAPGIAKTQNRVPTWVMPLVKGAVMAVDGLLAALCFFAAFVVREGEPVFSETAWAWSQEFVPYAGIFYFAVVIRVVMLVYERVFRYHGAFSYTQEAIKLFKAVFTGSLLIVAWAFLFRGGFAFREFSYARGVFVLDFAIALAVFTAFHLGLRFLQTLVRNRDVNLIPTLVVGTNSEAVQTVAELRDRPELGYRVVGVISSGPQPGGERWPGEASAPLIGNFEDLPSFIRELAIQEVIITDNTIESEKLFESMMQIGRKQKVEFRVAPSLFNMLPQKTSVDQIGVLPMVRLFREPLSDAERFLKRASDIVVSALALVIVSPFWLIVSVLIKRGSPGPVLFRQERVGMDGRIFLCYKFRTMYTDSDDRIHREAYRKNIEGTEDANAGDVHEPVFGKVKDDPRITPTGRWLRRSSLDELPQLLNVVKGDMSIVGPRPPIPYEVHEYGVRHRKRLDMKPGITGLWQVSGRNRLTFEEMVRTDIYYIENWSIWLDLKIILLTLPAVFRGDGAR